LLVLFNWLLKIAIARAFAAKLEQSIFPQMEF